MNKNVTPIYIFIVFLSIVTIDNVYGGSNWQLDRIERKIDNVESQQTRRQFQQIGRQFQQTSQQIVAQNQQAKKNHNYSIINVHPDYKKIAYGLGFTKWISSMPPKELIRAKDIVYKGTADEIILLLSGYKGKYIPPILKRKRMVAKFLLGRKKTVKPRKNVGIFAAYASAASNAIKNRYKLGMVNKNEILHVLSGYNKVKEERENMEIVHYVHTWPSGDKYEGGWKNDTMHGQGIYTYANGDKYEGGWKGGTAHGFGTYTGTDGLNYVGEWKDDKRDGQGTYTGVDGSNYVGQWKDGQRYGRGTYTGADGHKYVGEWEHNIQYGQGIYTYPDGAKYEGGWKYDMADGFGTFVWADGSNYVGEWKGDKRDGQGTYTGVDGIKHEGKWKGDKFVE